MADRPGSVASDAKMCPQHMAAMLSESAKAIAAPLAEVGRARPRYVSANAIAPSQPFSLAIEAPKIDTGEYRCDINLCKFGEAIRGGAIRLLNDRNVIAPFAPMP